MAVRWETTTSEPTLREVARLNRISWIPLLLMGGSLVSIIVTTDDVGSEVRRGPGASPWLSSGSPWKGWSCRPCATGGSAHSSGQTNLLPPIEGEGRPSPGPLDD